MDMNDVKDKPPITKDMTVAEIIERDPEAAYSLMSMGLGCAGCPMSQFETLEQGAAVHGLDADAMLKNLTYTDAPSADDTQ